MLYDIGIDIRMIHNTGIGTYLKGLLNGLRDRSIEADLSLRARKLCLFGQAGNQFDDYDFLPRRDFHSRIYSVQEQVEYPWRLKACQLWHAPHYNVPFWKGKTRLVVTLHDLIHWLFRKDFFSPLQGLYAGKMLRRSVSEADHIIAVSERTKHDLVNHFDADPERISVIYEAVSEDFQPLSERGPFEKLRKKYGLPEKFFLYVGMIKPHKNVAWLVKFFKKFQDDFNAGLVVVGRVDKKYQEALRLFSRGILKPPIYHLPFVEQDELMTLYSHCQALVHPSLYEGFGLTLLEAMACDAPVIAFRTGSIEEVAGPGAHLVEPNSESQLREALMRCESAPSYREDLIRRGRQHVRRFSWSECARQTLDVYEKVLRQ